MFSKLQAKKPIIILIGVLFIFGVVGIVFVAGLNDANQKADSYIRQVAKYRAEIQKVEGERLAKTLQAQPNLDTAVLGSISGTYKKAQSVRAITTKMTSLLGEMNTYELKKGHIGSSSFYTLSSVTLKTDSQRSSIRSDILTNLSSLNDSDLKERYVKIQENELTGAVEYRDALKKLKPETSYHKLVVSLMQQRNQELIETVSRVKKQYVVASEKDFLNNIDGLAKTVDDALFNASVAQAALVNADEMLSMKIFKPAVLKQAESLIQRVNKDYVSDDKQKVNLEVTTYTLLSKGFIPSSPSRSTTTDTQKLWPLHGVNDAVIALTNTSLLSPKEKAATIKALEDNALAYKLLVQSSPSSQRSYLADLKDLVASTHEDDVRMKAEKSSPKELAGIPEQRIKKLQALQVHPYIKSDIESLITYSQDYKTKITTAQDRLDAMYEVNDYQDGLEERVLKIADKLDAYDNVVMHINQTVDRSL